MLMPLMFDDLWKRAIKDVKARNGMSYHSCCDVWTTRPRKAFAESHIRTIRFQRLISTLEGSIDEKKKALKAKMIEEGFRLPALINLP